MKQGYNENFLYFYLSKFILFFSCTSKEQENIPQIKVDSDQILQDIQSIIHFSPRPSGTQNLEKCAQFLINSAKKNNVTVTPIQWTEKTPEGPKKFINIEVIIPGKDQSKFILIGSHFDSKNIPNHQGANDGGSSSAVLLELIRLTKINPPPVTLRYLFFDGEESLYEYNEIDGLHGSRYYAQHLKKTNEHENCLAMILLDMVGDKDLTLTLPADTPDSMLKVVKSASAQLQQTNKISIFKSNIIDDHQPFDQIGIPAIDLIDFSYGPNNMYWHTSFDTIDKLSKESLEFITKLTFITIWKCAINPPERITP